MVDFSDRNEIRGWLEHIEPAERRHEVAVVVAARAALRVTPLLQGAVRWRVTHTRALADIVLPCLRGTALPWAASKYPARRNELRAAAVSATAADAADAASAFATADTVFTANAAAAAANAAASPDAASASAFAAAAAAAAFAADAASASAFASDAARIDSRHSIDVRHPAAALAGMPLWPMGPPNWASEAWRSLKSALLATKDDWEVWTDWYEARLYGDDAVHPPNEVLEIARATIPDAIWRQGPPVVNAEIRRLIEKHSAPGTPEMDPTYPSAKEEDSFYRILVTRTVLRVLPILATDTGRKGDKDKSRFALHIFHTLAAAWTKNQFSSRVDAKLVLDAAANVRAFADRSGLAARLLGEAASNAAFSVGGEDRRVILSRARVAYEKVKQAIAAVSRDPALAVIVEQAYASDKADIVPGVRPEQLGQISLWAGRDPPALIGEHWRTLKEQLRFADEGWDVWIDWYEARLDGSLRSQDVELAYVNFVHNVAPTASASEVNSEIKRLIELANADPNALIGTNQPTAGTAFTSVGTLLSAAVVSAPAIDAISERAEEHTSLQQRPAAYRFRVVENKIDALPDDARPIDAEVAGELYDEVRRKAGLVQGQLQVAQGDANVRAHVALLLSRLGEDYRDMRPGLMLSVLRSLESDVRAYDGEEGRKELRAAHLSGILDLTESVRDLCAIFPRSREIEAEAVSLGLPMERMPQLRATIDEVVSKVNHSDGATEAGREAMNASAADLAHQRSLAEEAKQSAYFLVDFANFARAGLSHLKTAGAAVSHEFGGLGEDSWREVRKQFPKGVGSGARVLGKAVVVGGVAGLMHWLGSDIAALGSMVAAYNPLSQISERIFGAPTQSPSSESAPAEPEDEAPEAPAPPKQKSRRPPAKTARRKPTKS